MRDTCPIRVAERLREVRITARDDLEVSRHIFHGQPSYVLRDPLTFETHRLSREDYQILVRLDRDRSLGDLFADLVAERHLRPEDEEGFYRFVVSLQRLGLLSQSDADGRTLFDRYTKRTQLQRRSKILGFLFLQIPLFNPDRFLQNTRFVGQLVFSAGFVLLWCFAMLASGWLLTERWGDFVEPIDSILAGRTLITVWATLIGLKVLHEFGHGWACKHLGGKVPEMGAYFIAMNPCAYVDASASWGFPRRWARVVVSLGGVYFESFAAMAALWFWAFSEPSMARSAAHHVVMMATVVTLFFNLNPLLKYDGYFILCDLTGVPNLRQKSISQFQAYLKYIFLNLPLEPRQRLSTRNVLMVVYAIAATCYKVSVVFAMSMLIAIRFPTIGILLASYYVLLTVGGVAWRLFKFLWLSDACRERRIRAALCSVGLVLSSACLLFAPAPHGPTTSGVLTREHVRALRTEAAGFLDSVFIQSGQRVDSHVPLARLTNEDLETTVAEVHAQLESLRIERRWLEVQSRVTEASKSRRRAEYLEQRLEAADRDLRALEIETDREGVVLQCLDNRDLGRFLPVHTPVAEIGWGRPVVRAWATAESFSDAEPSEGDNVECRFHALPGVVFRGKVISLATASQRQFDRPELTQFAGGEIVVDPQTGLSEESRFQVSVAFDKSLPGELRDGCRVAIRLEQPRQTLAEYTWRRVRRGLQRLNVL